MKQGEYSADEVEMLCYLRDHNATWKEIAEMLGRSSWVACRARWLKEQDGLDDAAERDARPPARIRPCMTCGEPFPSAHVGNRMCDTCRELSVSPYAMDAASGDA